jgi:DUF2934 family protein
MFARSIGDDRTVQTILAFTDELDDRATMLDRPTEEQIRVRARELWENAGKPTDRDEDFWFEAENSLIETARRNKEN